MYDIVPGALQHLREADILSKAGLAVAAQGQEYSRTGAVHSTYRQGARLSGIVDVAGSTSKGEIIGIDAAKAVEMPGKIPQRFAVTVEIIDANAWHFTCACTPTAAVSTSFRLCVHAAALLYYWLARPFAFAVPSSVEGAAPLAALSSPTLMRSTLSAAQSIQSTPPTTPAQPVKTADSLALLAPPDLRSIAKEYAIAANGLNKQELIENILSAFRQPEVVRRTAGTLEKTHRQFLATFTLAGGYMSDQELRGLFERFALGKQEQFQHAMAQLQARGLVLRASSNSAQHIRANLSSSSNLGSLNPLEVTWHVPPEVCAALTITLPVTPFRAEEQPDPPVIHLAEPYRLLADLLLVARALEGQATPREEKRAERRGITGSLMRPVTDSPPSAASPSSEGSLAIPPPTGLLSPTLLAQDAVTFTPAFLRFAHRILRMGEILYTETETPPVTPQIATSTSNASATLRMLPNAAELLLGPTRREVTLELFSHWLRQATYIELFELSESALRLRCRTIAPNQPALRQGELEAENREARQWLISLLAQAPLRQWISFPAFARFVFRLNPTFLQRRQHLFPTPHWWIEQDEGHPLHPEMWNDWQRADGQYLALMLQGPLFWWGACDIALSRGGQLQAFRLTPLAEDFLHSPAHILFGSSEVSQATQRHRAATIDPASSIGGASDEALHANPSEPVEPAMYDMSGIELSDQGDVLIVSSAGNWPLIDLVERFTHVAGAQAGRLRYQITPTALSEALRRGEDLSPFLELLRCAREAGQGDGPIAEMLSRLEQRIASYGRVRLYTGATLLAAADALTLRELTATTSIEQQTIRVVHPTLLVLKKQGGEQLIDELKRRGQAPLLHEGD